MTNCLICGYDLDGFDSGTNDEICQQCYDENREICDEEVR